MSTAPIRTAVIGYGLAVRVFHCPFISAVPGLALTGIAQRTGDTAAAAYPNATIFRTPEDAFLDPAIDLIVIATPNTTHTELTAAALRAGKHVVVDKPLATSSADARDLIDLAASEKRILAPFHNRRYDGDFLTVKKLLTEGTLGRVTHIMSRFDRFRPIQRPGTWKETGGLLNGMLFDLGPHLVDQAIALFGPPDRITASDRRERDHTDIDDAFNIVLDYANPSFNGVPLGKPLRYTCEASMLAADPSPRFQVQGTLGAYTKRGVDPQEPTILNTPQRPPIMGSPQPWLPEPESSWGTLFVATKTTEPIELSTQLLPTETGDYRRFYANVRDAIHGAAPLAIPAEDAFKTLRLLELAIESSHHCRTLDVHF
jgi:scyllo-inositol 2-dehydrogenase (NADP+)